MICNPNLYNMKEKHIERFRHAPIYVSITTALVLILFSACTRVFNVSNPIALLPAPVSIDSAHWIDWNIMFPPGTSNASIDQEITNIEGEITRYLAPHGYIGYYHVLTCPCDSILRNLTAIPVLGSGQAFQPPPTPPPPPGGSGNGIAYTASLNNPLLVDMPVKAGDPNNVNAAPSKRLPLKDISVDNSKTLAIMDTGLDTSYFSNPIANMLWTDPQGLTLRNFTFSNPTFPLDYFADDHPGKHGTGVTGIAVHALGETGSYPRIMVLKVLDNNEKGSTFGVSCALSYAVQHHATLVNASLGYYNTATNDIDPVLFHYTDLCNHSQNDSIFVFSAAGHSALPHTTLCAAPSKGNELSAANGNTRLFYPACFSNRLMNVITITGLSNLSQSCFYQNYSAKYVSAGVLNAAPGNTCCAFPIAAMNLSFEGSSFATPVASGKVMGCLLNTTIGTARSTRQCLNSITQTSSSLTAVTVNGKYIDNTKDQR